MASRQHQTTAPDSEPNRGAVDVDPEPPIRLFLCGDVMLGRGIDQILPHPSQPDLHEPYVRDARDYVRLAERVSGPVPRQVAWDYVWGDALDALENYHPDLRLINLETSITSSNQPWPDKDIHYRMHPANLPCLQAAGIQVCALANNHVLDWGRAGLAETLTRLQELGIAAVGAGEDLEAAQRPAVLPLPGRGRVVVLAFGDGSSGIPAAWTADPDRSGVDRLPGLSAAAAAAIAQRVAAVKRPGDRVIASIHWGSNWGYQVPPAQREFAHALIDTAGVDLIHGHSSHHPRPLEVYRDRLILYGCGDFLNDYEGIGGYEAFRGELSLMYWPELAHDGALRALRMTPMRIRRLRLERASAADAAWLATTLSKVSRGLGSMVTVTSDSALALGW